MKQLYLALGILLQLNSRALFAQKAQEWHYNLSPQVAKQLFLGKALDTSMIGKPQTSESFDSLPIQHHLLVQNKAEELQLSLQSKANFTVRAIVLGSHLGVQILDAQGESIKSAKVVLNGTSLVFEAGLNLFRYPNFMPVSGTLSVTLGEHTFYYQLNATKVNAPRPVAAPSRDQADQALRGYVAFCKPVFRPRDTLKAKIYAAKPNGKPYAGKLRLELNTDKLWWDTLVIIKRGTFAFELPLADTLPLDQTYTLSAKALDNNIKQTLSHTFHLEDYQLNEVQYNLYLEKDKFHAGEKIKLNLVAQTVYNTAVPDAEVSLRCQWYGKTIWEYQNKLGEAGELEMEIPTDLLPKTPCVIKVWAGFSRPGEALQIKEISFWYSPLGIDLYVDNSKLHASSYGETYQLWAEYNWGRQLLYAGKDSLIIPINPNLKGYSAGFNKPETYLDLQNGGPGAVGDQLIWTTRNLKNKQSISLHNPFGISIWYQISNKNGLIKQGWIKDTMFRWTQQEKKPQDMYLQYQYWWGSNLVLEKRLIPYQKKQVKIEWIAPERVYPGQNLDLQIRAQDERSAPLAGVDLAAGAINAQFGEDLPHSPLALTSDQKLPISYWDIQVVPSKKEWKQPLDYTFYKKLDCLSSDPFYRYRFLENGFLSQAIALNASRFYQEHAFFAPFVVKQGKVQPVMLVYLNDTLTYFGGSGGSGNYHFCTSPGYKSIRVRTKEGVYQLDSMYLKLGHKLNLIVDALNFKNSEAAKQITFSPMPDTLVDAEKQLLAKSMLLMSDLGGEYAWDNFGHSYYQRFNTGFLGPFIPGSTIQYIQRFYRKQVFEFPIVDQKVSGLKMVQASHFDHKNVCPEWAPSFFDSYSIPLVDRTVQEAYNLSGFRIEQPGKQEGIEDFCLQIGVDGVLRGRVVDETLSPLIGTNILVKQTTLGCVSDYDGSFTLNMSGLSNHQIIISYTGYQTREFKTCQTEIPLSGDIVLYESTDLLSEVVVVGYGVQKRSESVASIFTISSQSIGRQKSSNHSKPAKPKPEKTKPSFEASELFSPTINGIRTHFSDYAFWQPNLLTDSEGKAQFSVKFPDNITSWQSFAIGVDQDGEMGLGLKNIAAFKPLQAQLYTPRFLVAGDQVQVNAKVTNLVSSPTLIHTHFKQNGQNLQDSNWIAPAFTNLTQMITAPTKTDSMALEFGLQTGQYIDGEARDLPIIPLGRMKPYGQFIEITQDTMIILPFTAGTPAATLTLEPGGALKLMLDDIKYLKEYRFGCNEQTSSKLTALLLEKSLRGMLGEPFTGEQEIYEGIAILEGRQQAEGGWCWWITGQQRYWTTNYVLKTLLRAAQAGYPVKVLKKGLEFLQEQLPQMNEEDYLISLETLTKAGINVDLTRLQQEPEAIAEQDLLYKKLLRQYLLQAHNLPYSLDTLYKYQRFEANRPGTYWDGREVFGFAGYRVADCSTQNTLIAYSIFKKAGKEDELKKIRSYFLNNRGFFEGNYRYGGRWNNTMEVAKILEAILPDLIEADKEEDRGNKKLEKKMAASHRLLALEQTPITLKLQQQDTFFIKLGMKTNSAYLTYIQYTNLGDSVQKTSSSNFVVQSQFLKNQEQTSVLQLNDPVNFRVDVLVKQRSRHVMIEIPIPAGCTYFNKDETRNPFEVNREYHADRVLIFCDELPAWNHEFRVQLIPQFAGKFTLNPVWVEDMYHPLDNGTNTIRKVQIRQ
ncbi:alpha-2-macroglobulin family protein [Haliscomenobacter sp.]|uniref:alpha-2-macroglobulin family protein n=1 Tax=Haliscomenobacter sp. TaxID=2717303 RepID=UPI003BAC7BF2